MYHKIHCQLQNYNNPKFTADYEHKLQLINKADLIIKLKLLIKSFHISTRWHRVKKKHQLDSLALTHIINIVAKKKKRKITCAPQAVDKLVRDMGV